MKLLTKISVDTSYLPTSYPRVILVPLCALLDLQEPLRARNVGLELDGRGADEATRVAAEEELLVQAHLEVGSSFAVWMVPCPHPNFETLCLGCIDVDFCK